MYTQQTTYDQPVSIRRTRERQGTYPVGQANTGAATLTQLPAVTGYYPNVSGSGLPTVVEKLPIDDFLGQYAHTANAIPESLAPERIDQHSALHVSQTWVPPVDTVRPTGRSDPAAAGLPRPDVDFVSSYFYRQQGSSATRLLDVPGKTFAPTGVQDDVTWTYVTSTQMQLAAYDPTQLVPSQDGQRMEMPDTLRAVAPSGARGWSAQPPVLSQQELNAKAKQLKQQQATGQNLLANSTYAGQSYGARTRRVGGPQARVAVQVRGGSGNGR